VTTIGGGVGVDVGLGVTGGVALGAPMIGVGKPAGVALSAGEGGGLVKTGTGGFTWARVLPMDATRQPAVKTAAQSEARRTRYAILASLRLTAEASNVL
jgi:hypothetical protein